MNRRPGPLIAVLCSALLACVTAAVVAVAGRLRGTAAAESCRPASVNGRGSIRHARQCVTRGCELVSQPTLTLSCRHCGHPTTRLTWH
jgi:hypothetical protein